MHILYRASNLTCKLEHSGIERESRYELHLQIRDRGVLFLILTDFASYKRSSGFYS